MIVCLCTGVSCREIKRLRDQGATTLRDVGRACGAAGQCGSCAPTVRALLKPSEGAPRADAGVAWQVAAK